jgi:signal peptidase I
MKRLRTLAAEAGPIALGLLVALVLRVIVFEPFTIPSASMEPGLLVGDYVVASKFDYGWSRYSIPFAPPLFAGRVMGRSPRRSDVVVFRLPRDPRVTYVKRLVGTPGDTVQVKDGAVWLNGRALPRTFEGRIRDPGQPTADVAEWRERQGAGRAYLTLDRGPGREGDDTAPLTVPADTYFFMGDNRDNSLDSRWSSETGVGLVPAENLIGPVRLVLFSWRPDGSWARPWTWFRWDRFLRPV